MTALYDSVRFGELELANRIVMAPLTRARATKEGRVPTPIMAEYYRQRASAGLIVGEATIVDPMGAGYEATPGIYSEEQIEAWKPITEAVHADGGLIVTQLWHVGRVSDSSLLGGRMPVAPSAIAPAGHVRLLRPERPYPVPRALAREEIPAIVESFKRAAENAQKAGFDGVEIHAANGYLIDQFLQDGSNKRDDEYGGPVENRARLLLAVTDAACAVWGAGRVGVHLSPRGESHDMSDSDRAGTFAYAARELGKRKLAFLFIRERIGEDSVAPAIKEAFGGPVILNEGFDKISAEAALKAEMADAVAFGKAYISNPDLVARLKANVALNPWDESSFYAGGERGYTDYPMLPE